MTLHTYSDETFVLSADSLLLKKAIDGLKNTATTRPVLIAISGESAAGKTTFLNTLKRILKSSTFIDADNYFIDMSEQIRKAGSFTNLVKQGFESEAPSSFQLDTMAFDLTALKSGKNIKIPYYRMQDGVSIPQAISIQSTPFIFVGGICTLFQPVCPLFDFKIYLEANEQLRYKRYLARASERGQTPQQALEQYAVIQQKAKKYIVPTKKQADIIVKGRLSKHTLTRLFINMIRQNTK